MEQIKPALIAMDKKEKNDKLLVSVRGKTYTQQELFGNAYDSSEYYKSYFEAFDDNKLLIDEVPTYTHIDGENLHFDLDDSGLDKDFNKNQSVALTEITDADGNFDEAKFKTKLASIVENIVKNNYM